MCAMKDMWTSTLIFALKLFIYVMNATILCWKALFSEPSHIRKYSKFHSNKIFEYKLPFFVPIQVN